MNQNHPDRTETASGTPRKIIYVGSDEYFAEKMANASRLSSDDLAKKSRHLLEDIYNEALSSPGERDPSLTVAMTNARLATLQVLLADKMDIVSRRNLTIQYLMVGLTTLILILTIVMLVIQIIQSCSS